MKLKVRESGIELLKIIAVFLIVISHAAQVLYMQQLYDICPKAYINLNHVTTNIQHLILIFFRYFGTLGNCIFFISSAWFLCDSNKRNTKKILQMIIDVWIISIIFLLVFVISGVNLSTDEIIKSIVPTTFSTTWFITCYLLLYSIHPYLNILVENISQEELLKINIVTLTIYFGGGYLIKRDLFFGNDLILFIVIYLLIAYIKKYLNYVFSNNKLNVTLVLLGILGNTGIVLLTNFLGLKVGGLLSEHMIHWSRNSSPFLLLIAIGLFNLFKNKKFTSKEVNKLSALSLMIYLIHENSLVKNYFYPEVFSVIYDKLGYSHIVIWVVLLAACIFIISALLGFIYKYMFQRITKIIADKFVDIMYIKVEKIVNSFIKKTRITG